jgi:curved DNA-binding protein CbpA
MATLYEILDVSEAATPEEIKDAYRRQAMKWHPDRNPDKTIEAERRFKEIAAAYIVLADIKQRADYDARLATQRGAAAGQQRRTSSSGPSVSENEAAKMFFDQMLDLAIEIAKRGYDEETIYKVLLGLDCPESVARVVASKSLRVNSASEASDTPHATYASSELQAWEQAKPYFAAIIGGVHADDLIPESLVAQMSAKRRKMFWYSLFGSAFFCGLFVGLVTSSVWHSMMAVVVGVCLSPFVAIVADHFLTANHQGYLNSKAIYYYLPIFEALHRGRPVPKGGFNWGGCFSASWLIYRKMYVLGISAITLFYMFMLVDHLISLQGLLNLTTSTAFLIFGGLYANRIYYWYAARLVAKVTSSPSVENLVALRSLGGTSGAALFAFFVIFSAISLPFSIAQIQQQEQMRVSAAKAKADANIREKLADEQSAAAQKAEMVRRVNVVVARITSSSPEFNEKSSNFDQRGVDYILENQKRHISLGLTPDVALDRAYRDYLSVRKN